MINCMKNAFIGKTHNHSKRKEVPLAVSSDRCLALVLLTGLMHVSRMANDAGENERPDGISVEKFHKYHGLEFPRMKDCLKMRHGTSDFNTDYETMLHVFMPHIMGAKIWTSALGNHTKLSDICTPSDEAFCLLTLENNYERWEAMANGREKSNLPKAAFTLRKRKGGCKFTSGWSEQGLERYIELYNDVKGDRDEEEVFEGKEHSFDSQFFLNYKDKGAAHSERREQDGKKKKKKKERQPYRVLELPNDL